MHNSEYKRVCSCLEKWSLLSPPHSQFFDRRAEDTQRDGERTKSAVEISWAPQAPQEGIFREHSRVFQCKR